jgi:molybdopterin-guanine dinucleotide biosynthesis protein A
MGTDKAQLLLGGVTLLERAIATAQDAGFAVSVSVAGPASALTGRLSRAGIPWVHDKYPEQGPLSGIEAALDSLVADTPVSNPQQPVLFLPVDLPRIPAAFLRWLWSRALSTDALATIPRIDGREQPLCAVYAGTLAAPLRQALAGGERKVIRALRQAVPGNRLDRFHVETVAPLLGWQRPQYWFTNVNTPEDWVALQQGTFRDEQAPSRI